MDAVLQSEGFKSFQEKWANMRKSPRQVKKKPAPKKILTASSKPTKTISKTKESITIQLDSLSPAIDTKSHTSRKPIAEAKPKSPRFKPPPLQKDSSGFLMPAPPPSKCQNEIWNLRHLVIAASQRLPEFEINHMLDKVIVYTERVHAKIQKNKLTRMRVEENHNTIKPVEKWVNETSRYYGSNPSTSATCSYQEETCRDRPMSFILSDWTVVKLPTSESLKLTGTLKDMVDKKVLEDCHLSSKVVERVSKRCVKTVDCKYHLVGKFVDPGKCLPKKVKDCFSDNSFPENWKDIIKLWNDAGTMKPPDKAPKKQVVPQKEKDGAKRPQKRIRNVSQGRASMENTNEELTPVLKRRRGMDALKIDQEASTPRTTRVEEEPVSLRTRKRSGGCSISPKIQCTPRIPPKKLRKCGDNTKKYPVTPAVKIKTAKHLTSFAINDSSAADASFASDF